MVRLVDGEGAAEPVGATLSLDVNARHLSASGRPPADGRTKVRRHAEACPTNVQTDGGGPEDRPLALSDQYWG